MVTAGEFCNRNVYTILRTDPVVEAARRMRTHHTGSLVVVEERGGEVFPVGIVTDRDIVIAVVATASPYLETLEVGEVAPGGVVVANESESLVDTLRRMRAHGIRRMPIVNERGALQGIVALDDLLAFLAEEISALAALVSREQEVEVQRKAG